ncbi:MAG: hypothetical protein V4625_09675 [Pseudomonadota bacterium]
MLRLTTSLFLIGLTSLLGGCEPNAPHTITLERYSLLKLVFPDWSGTASMVQTVDLSALRKKTSSANTGMQRAQVFPLYVVKLDDIHAVLLTQTLPVGNGEEPHTCHGCSGFVSAYFFTRDDAGWKLSGRQDAVTTSGVEGEIGKTAIARLGEAHYAFTSEWGSCWQGYCGSWLEVVSLRPDKAVAATLRSSIDNDGVNGACSELDVKDSAVHSNNVRACHQVVGSWKFAAGHLIGDFRGRLTPTGKSVQKIHEQATYTFSDGTLRLERGTNPIPDF